MSTPLTCPGCKSPIPVPMGFAEPMIRCGICWTAVPFEASEAAPPPLVVPVVAAVVVEPPAPVAAAIPSGAPAEMAKLEAILTAADTRTRPAPRRAKAITVTPATAIIPPPLDALPVVTPRRATRTAPAMSSDPPPKPRYRPRDEEAEDEDTPAKRPSRTGALVAALLAAGVLLLGLAVGGFFLLKTVFGDKTTDVAGNADGDGNPPAGPQLQFELPQAKEPNNRPPNAGVPPRGNKRGQNPPAFGGPQFGGPQAVEPPAVPAPPPFGGGPAPVMPPPLPEPPFDRRGGMVPPPQPQRPADPEWEPVPGTDGFTVQMPGRPNPRDHFLHVYRRGGGNLDFVPAHGKKWSMNDPGYRFEAEYVLLPNGFTPDITRTVAQGRQTETKPVRVNGRAGEEVTIAFGAAPEVKRGVVVGRRLYLFTTHLVPRPGRGPADANAARERFFDSITLAQDGEQPPPRNDPPAGDRMPATVSASHKLQAFSAAVVLPKKGEVLTFGTRIDNRGWEIRRHSYPGFVPRATYYISHPVADAVYDEASGRLLVTAVTANSFGFLPGERSVVGGIVQVYDADKLTGNNLADRDVLKADGQLILPGGPTWIAGLAAAGGKGLVLTLTPPTGNRPFKGRLHQFDPSTGKLLQSLDLPDPAWRLAVSPDGSRAYTSSVALKPGTVPVPASTETGYVQTIDVPAWKRDRSVSLSGMVFDLSLTRDGRPLAVLTTGRVFALPAGNGEAVELGTLPPVLNATAAEYAAVTADGKKLVASRYGSPGVRVMSLGKWDGPAGMTQTAAFDQVLIADRPGSETKVGGFFHLTPDGKFALFRSGLVLPLDR